MHHAGNVKWGWKLKGERCLLLEAHYCLAGKKDTDPNNTSQYNRSSGKSNFKPVTLSSRSHYRVMGLDGVTFKSPPSPGAHRLSSCR